MSNNLDDFAQALDDKFGNVENCARQLGLDAAYDSVMDAVGQVSPAARQATDDLLGAARILLDRDGNGTIEFSEVLGSSGAQPGQGPLDPVQLRLQLMQTLLQTQMQIFASAWTGFGNNGGGGGPNPFLLPLQNAIGIMLQRAGLPIGPGGSGSRVP